MKINRLLPILFLMIACSSNKYTNNQKMIASIDSMEISKTIMEVETDSIGNALDTVSISHFKYDGENKKRYHEKVYRYKDIETIVKNYFKPNEDLFYYEFFNGKAEPETIFEMKFDENGRVFKGSQINYENEPIDTTIMDYSHKYYPNGKAKNLIMRILKEEVIYEIEYDEYEKPLVEVIIMNNDTMSFQTWEYTDSVHEKNIYKNFRKDTSKSIYYFENEKMLIKEEDFKFENGELIKSKEINHFYDESNDKMKTIERNLETKKVKYLKYIKDK